MAEPLKFCKDCRHYRTTFTSLFDSSLARCMSPKLMRTDLTTGKSDPGSVANEREFEHRCGRNARFFEKG